MSWELGSPRILLRRESVRQRIGSLENRFAGNSVRREIGLPRIGSPGNSLGNGELGNDRVRN